MSPVAVPSDCAVGTRTCTVAAGQVRRDVRVQRVYGHGPQFASSVSRSRMPTVPSPSKSGGPLGSTVDLADRAHGVRSRSYRNEPASLGHSGTVAGMPDLVTDPEDWRTRVTALLLGASHSIDVLAGRHVWTLGDPSNIYALADKRLQLRCVLRQLPPSVSDQSDLHIEHIEQIHQSGWKVRRIDAPPSINCLIVDRQRALLSNIPQGGVLPSAYLLESKTQVEPLVEHFQRLWDAPQGVTLLHEDLLVPSCPPAASAIAKSSEGSWNRLIARLAQDPELLYSVPPRRFEELVAELLHRDGLIVTLTPQTHDGGRDILAISETPLGEFLYLVECKRWSKNRPVDVSLVRELYGVVARDRATAGMIVTTSYFSRDSLKFRDEIRYQMGLKDYQGLVAWLRKGRSGSSI